MTTADNHPQRYPTDLSDSQWYAVRTLLPRPTLRGRPRTADLRAIVNAIRYRRQTGCAWRMLPHDFPPWPTVYTYSKAWLENGLWQQIDQRLQQRQTADVQNQPEMSEPQVA